MIKPLRDSVLELGQELDHLIIVGQLPQRSGEILDPFPVDPGLNFGLNGLGDSGDGVSRGSASEEAGEAMAAGVLQGVDQVLEAGEMVGEGGEMWVAGEERVGLSLELEQSFNGGGVGIIRIESGAGLEMMRSLLEGFKDCQNLWVWVV